MRRGVDDLNEFAYYVVFAPKETTALEEAVRVAGARWQVESCFELAKGQFGLAEFEVRKWEARHRYVMQALLTRAFVSVVHPKEALKHTGGTPVVLSACDSVYATRTGGTIMVSPAKTPPDEGQVLPLP